MTHTPTIRLHVVEPRAVGVDIHKLQVAVTTRVRPPEVATSLSPPLFLFIRSDQGAGV